MSRYHDDPEYRESIKKYARESSRRSYVDRKRYALQNCINSSEFDIDVFTDDDIRTMDIELHHVDPSTKKFNPLTGSKTPENADFQNEVKKCIALTSSEHRALTSRTIRTTRSLYNQICGVTEIPVPQMVDHHIFEMALSIVVYNRIIAPRFTTVHNIPNLIDTTTGIRYYAPFL